MQRNHSSKNSSRRDLLRYASLAGVVGFSGFTGLKSVSKPAIAAPTGTPRIAEGIRAGEQQVSPYDIEYQNLDASSPIIITYIFTYSNSSKSTATHTVDISGKSNSGTISTGSHTVIVPPGDIKLSIEVSHPSLSSTLSTSPSSEYTVLATASIVDDGGTVSDAFNGETFAGTVSISPYDIKYNGLDTSSSVTVKYVLTNSSGSKSTHTHGVSLSGKSKTDTVSTSNHDISVPAGTLDLDIELSHPSLGENIVSSVGSIGEVLPTAFIVDGGTNVSNSFDGETIAGENTIFSYNIKYDGLDTSSQIIITYVFTDSSNSTSTATHTVDISGKSESATVSAGSHSISVPKGTLDLDVEISHPSLASKEITDVGSIGEVLPDTVDANGGTTIIDRNIGGEDYRIHAFEYVGNDTFTVNSVPPDADFDVLVVAGGGGGGRGSGGGAGGGGAGGVAFAQNVSLSAGNYDVEVGDGANSTGKGGSKKTGDNGEDSFFDNIRAIGGGGGAGATNGTGPNNGGSGGGNADDESQGGPGRARQPGTNSQAQDFGHDGGRRGDNEMGSGGGGAGQPGRKDRGKNNRSGNGGDGVDFSSTFTTRFGDGGEFGGGGGGGTAKNDGGRGRGGDGGGGRGAGDGRKARSGDRNTGGGGGGGTDAGKNKGRRGGSGIVLIRYKI